MSILTSLILISVFSSCSVVAMALFTSQIHISACCMCMLHQAREIEMIFSIGVEPNLHSSDSIMFLSSFRFLGGWVESAYRPM